MGGADDTFAGECGGADDASKGLGAATCMFGVRQNFSVFKDLIKEDET